MDYADQPLQEAFHTRNQKIFFDKHHTLLYMQLNP